MNCFEELNTFINNCDVCYECSIHNYIVSFKDLPESEKQKFDYYEENKHLLIHCRKCQTFEILGS